MIAVERNTMKYRVTQAPKFRVSNNHVQSRSAFFDDLTALDQEMFGGKFFDNLTQMRVNKVEAYQQEMRLRERRQRNLDRAENVLKRLRRVRAMNLFEMTQSMTPDFFGEVAYEDRVTKVKELHDKKARIEWFLLGLYRYFAFGVELHGWAKRRGFRYSRHRKHYEVMLENLREQIRQKKWDLKRAKVRARRNKLKEKGRDPQLDIVYKLRRGMGNSVPLPVELLGVENIIWD